MKNKTRKTIMWIVLIIAVISILVIIFSQPKGCIKMSKKITPNNSSCKNQPCYVLVGESSAQNTIGLKENIFWKDEIAYIDNGMFITFRQACNTEYECKHYWTRGMSRCN